MIDTVLLRVVYAANVVVAGWIGLSCLFTEHRGALTVFEGTVEPSEGLRVTGALWLAIAVCSAWGLVRPASMTGVLWLQLVYKATWLLVAALPAWRAGEAYPSGMAGFFVVWVAALAVLLPWRALS